MEEKPQKKIRSFGKKIKRSDYLSAEEALELGIIDKIV